MLPVFIHPLALFGLLALPALGIVYLLRQRYRRQTVSSLLLWIDPDRPRDGGPRLDRLQTPLLFFLELLILALLAIAAAGPLFRASRAGRPLVVVLDDSYSMLAGAPDSPHAAALAALEKELREGDRPSIRFVLAGEKPVLLGRPVTTLHEANQLLKNWRCQSPVAAIPEALALAAEDGGESAALLVLTDHAPATPLDRGRILWRSFGRSRANVAIVSAARTFRDGADHGVIAVENLGDEETSTTLVVEIGDPGVEVERRQLALKPGEPVPAIFRLKEGAPVLRARIDDDALSIDNQATLLPAPPRLVRVQLDLTDPTLLEQTRKALRASRAAEIVTGSPMLLIGEGVNVPRRSGDQWVLHLESGTHEAAFDGPFVLERLHPLTAGLSLQGVIWSPGARGDIPGSPVVMAGNTVLVADSEDGAGRHLVRLRMRHDRSSLFGSSSWQVLVSNLLSWRAAQLPGLANPNVRLGEDVTLVLDRLGRDVGLRLPDGSVDTLPVQDGRAVTRAARVGIHEMAHGGQKWLFAVNATHREESDLRRCVSGTFGDWLDDAALQLDYQRISWAILLAILCLSALHLLLVNRLGVRARR